MSNNERNAEHNTTMPNTVLNTMPNNERNAEHNATMSNTVLNTMPNNEHNAEHSNEHLPNIIDKKAATFF